MQIQAAVAHRAGARLPKKPSNYRVSKAGKVLVEIKATGICHTDGFTLSGAAPEGLFLSENRSAAW